MPIRVAFDARIFGRRGIGRYTEGLLSGLSLFPDQVIAIPMFGRGKARGKADSVALRLPGYILQEQVEYAVRLRDPRYDLVHLTANTSPLLRFRWPPTIVTVHDVIYLMTRTELPISPSLRQSLGRLYRRLSFFSGTVKVDRLIADSAHTARELAKRVKRLPPVDVVHPGVDARFFQDRPKDLSNRHSATYPFQAGNYFLHPGAVDPRKNTRVVLSAFERYRARGGSAELVVVGLSNGHMAVLRAAPQRGCHLLPFVSNDDLLMLLQFARGLIYVPSEEGFGYPLVEAMAAEVPAIISAIDVLDEMSGGCAWEVSPGDAEALAVALLEFDANSRHARDLALRGKVRAQEEFTTRRMAEQTLQVYEEAMAHSSFKRVFK